MGSFTWSYLRLAEIYLNYAEACNEKPARDAKEALVYINKIRERAGLGKLENAYPAVVDSKEELRKWIRQERMVELAFEGHRFWDLRRWGLASTVLNGTSMHGVKPIKVGDNEFTYEVVDIDGGKTRVWEERYARFPIPLGEIEQNEAVQQFDEWK